MEFKGPEWTEILRIKANRDKMYDILRRFEEYNGTVVRTDSRGHIVGLE